MKQNVLIVKTIFYSSVFESPAEIFNKIGHIPLPPYIKEMMKKLIDKDMRQYMKTKIFKIQLLLNSRDIDVKFNKKIKDIGVDVFL